MALVTVAEEESERKEYPKNRVRARGPKTKNPKIPSVERFGVQPLRRTFRCQGSHNIAGTSFRSGCIVHRSFDNPAIPPVKNAVRGSWKLVL